MIFFQKRDKLIQFWFLRNIVQVFFVVVVVTVVAVVVVAVIVVVVVADVTRGQFSRTFGVFAGFAPN